MAKTTKSTHFWASILKRITLLDIVVSGVVLLALIIFFFVFRRQVTYVTARFKVTDENPLYAMTVPNNEYSQSFTIGDVENGELGKADAEIVGVESFKNDAKSEVVYLDIKLKATYNPRKNVYYFRGRPLVFGEMHTFTFSKVRFKALVVDFPGFYGEGEVNEEKVIVEAKLRDESRSFSDTYGVPEYVAQAVKVGDEVKNSQGAVIAKIVDVKIEPARRTVVSDNGQPFVVIDPLLKDVTYVIELTTKEIRGKTYMYSYIPVAVDQEIPLNLPHIFLEPVITAIKK